MARARRGRPAPGASGHQGWAAGPAPPALASPPSAWAGRGPLPPRPAAVTPGGLPEPAPPAMAARRLWPWLGLAWLLSLPPAAGLPLAPGPRDEVLAAALQRLREVFDIEELPLDVLPRKKPPQFMVDLFNKVADANGITRAPGLLEGDVVRSFEDRGGPGGRGRGAAGARPRGESPAAGAIAERGQRPPCPVRGPFTPGRLEQSRRLLRKTGRGCVGWQRLSCGVSGCS